MSKTKYFIQCVSIAVILIIASCSKSTKYDVTGETQVKFYMNIVAYANSPQNSLSYSAVDIPYDTIGGLLTLSSTLPTQIKFPVFATAPVSQDVSITATPDTSLVSQYNAENGTNYVILPSGILNTDTTLIAHILRDSTKSSDSITISTIAANLAACTDTVYMLPIKLTSVSNTTTGAITSTASQQVVYIIIHIEQRLINYLATTGIGSSTLISPKTSWYVGLTPAPTTTGSIIDGSTSTYSRWTPPVTPYGEVDVNMRASQNVTGIRMYTYASTTYTPSQVNVYLSSDSVNYQLIGKPLKANIYYSSGYTYIFFYKAIQAQYLRLQLLYSTSTNNNNGKISELDVYTN